LYRKSSAFGGGMVEVMDKHFNKMGIFIEGIKNATLNDYEKEKDKAILGIGKEIKSTSTDVSKKDSLVLQKYKVLSIKVGKLKYPIKNKREQK
jgi:hypothetical protein